MDGEGARRSTSLERLTGEGAGSSNSETMGFCVDGTKEVASTVREAVTMEGAFSTVTRRATMKDQSTSPSPESVWQAKRSRED